MGYLVALAVGAKVYGDFTEGQAKKNALKAQAKAKREQARLLMETLDINVKSLREEGLGFQQDQISAFAKGGIDVGSGAALAVLEDTQRKVNRKIVGMTRQAEFDKQQLLSGADISSKTAGDLDTAGFFQTVGTISSGFKK